MFFRVCHKSPLCQEAGFTPRIVQEAVRLQTIASLVATGMGVALVPAWVRHIRQAGIAYKDLKDRSSQIHLDVGIAWSKENHSPILPKFIGLAKEISKHWSKTQSKTEYPSSNFQFRTMALFGKILPFQSGCVLNSQKTIYSPELSPFLPNFH